MQHDLPAIGSAARDRTGVRRLRDADHANRARTRAKAFSSRRARRCCGPQPGARAARPRTCAANVYGNRLRSASRPLRGVRDGGDGRSRDGAHVRPGRARKRKRTPAEAGVRGSRLAIVSCDAAVAAGYGVASVAASALTMPVPRLGLCGEANGEAVFLIVASTCAGVRSVPGLDCISATTPATNGAAIEVPL